MGNDGGLVICGGMGSCGGFNEMQCAVGQTAGCVFTRRTTCNLRGACTGMPAQQSATACQSAGKCVWDGGCRFDTVCGTFGANAGLCLDAGCSAVTTFASCSGQYECSRFTPDGGALPGQCSQLQALGLSACF